MEAPFIPGYELVERVGRGRSGEVWLARREGDGQNVALKIGHPSPRHSAEDIDFKLEFQLHSRLEHPHILAASQFGEIDETRRYYTMEYVPRIELAELYREGGIQALGEVALAICSALECAHAQGVLHGDIKPANLLVSANADGTPDRILLADFGHASRLGTDRSDIRGTLAYLPPEALSSVRTDPRSDLYSLGATLFEAIAGRPLFPADTPERLLDMLAEQDSPSVEEFGALDPQWVTFLDSLVARRREDRPRSATAAAEAIAALLGRAMEAEAERRPAPHVGSTLTHVGREHELEQARQMLRDTHGPRTLVVTGERGVGKSRFAEELAQGVALDGGIVYRSDAREASSGGFRVLQRVMQQGRVRDVQGAAANPASGGAEIHRLVDAFLGPETRDQRPRLFVFDSVEAADADSLEFLRGLQTRMDGRSLLCLVGRDDRDGSVLQATNGRPAEVVRLEPFGQDETRQLVALLLGESDRPDRAVLDEPSFARLATWIERESGGNPQRVERLVKRLVRERALVRAEGGGWRLDGDRMEGATPVGDPEGDPLDPGVDRTRLEQAAVAAPSFDAATLAALGKPGDSGVETFLDDTLRAGVLVRGRDNLYRFADPDLQRVIYARLDERVRRDLHARVAAHLASSRRARPAEIARHVEAAGSRAAASEAWLTAAASLRAEGAVHGATSAYRRAWTLRSPGTGDAPPDFVRDWVELLETNGRYEEAAAICDEVLAMSPGPTLGVPLRIVRAACRHACGDTASALEELRAVVANADLSDASIDTWARSELGSLELNAGNYDEAEEQLTRARERALGSSLLLGAGRAELRLGTAAWRRGQPDRALKWLAKAESHLKQAHDDQALPMVWGNQAVCYWDLLEIRRAADAHRRSAEANARQHRRQAAARSYQNLAYVLIELGRWREAESALGEADRLHGSVAGPRDRSFYERTRACLAWYRGELDRARECVTRAVELARDLPDPYPMLNHLALRARVELERGAGADAGETARECLRIAGERSDSWGLSQAEYILGQVAASEGKHSEALAAFDRGLEAIGDRLTEVRLRILAARAEVLAATAAPRGMTEALREAEEIAQRSGSPLWRALVQLSAGRATGLREEHDTACRHYAAAYETFAALGADLLSAQTLVARATSHHALGNDDAARAAWRHAVRLHRELGLAPPDSPLPTGADDGEESLRAVQRTLAAAAAVSRDITKLQSVDEVVKRILDVAIHHLGTERGVVALTNPTTGELEVRYHRNIDPESLSDGVEISRSALAAVGSQGEMVHTGDALADPRLSTHESIRQGRIRSLIALPIRWGDRVLGALYMDHRVLTDLFGPEARLFLRFIADMAAIGIHNARRFEIVEDENRSLRGELEEDELIFPRTVVGQDPRMRQIVQDGVRAAAAREIILLTGPSGVGKDHFARIFHEQARLDGEFVHCALPELHGDLALSELFGIVKSMATGVESRPGLIEHANGGTLFLNEIADLPLPMQPMLLRFLDTLEFKRIGGTDMKRFEGLIVCATNARLEERIAEGSFRSDLFYRFHRVLEIPALRDRPGDIPALVDLFLDQEHRRTPDRPPCVVDRRVMDLLRACRWDGNVRELESCVLKAARACEDGIIRPQHLDTPSLRREDRVRSLPASGGVRQEVEEVEMRRIREAMTRAGGITKRAAQLLGMHEKRLSRRLKKFGLGHLQLRQPRRHARKD